MKKLLLSAIFASLSFVGYSQTFYVVPTEKGYEKKISDKLNYEGYKLATVRDSSDYIVDCLVDGQYNAWKIGNMFHGYVKISDRKSGKELGRTKEVGKSPGAVNGYQAAPKIMAVIADKYLIDEVKKVLKQTNI